MNIIINRKPEIITVAVEDNGRGSWHWEEIVSDLMRSKNTVDAHRRYIMDKTGCNSIVGLIRYAIRESY